ncbi:hypothetical protein, partial [Myxococcus xanthus]|uniref:hypothetical protein n=1 Tax=Myxococcus xanthus TaxID=34 RepID=UPI0039F0834B
HVLNAFRHHGDRHLASQFLAHRTEGCSTPSGITASGTIGRIRSIRPDFLCSTPSGITASGTPPSRLHGARRGFVLNAFRHHGERHLLI